MPQNFFTTPVMHVAGPNAKRNELKRKRKNAAKPKAAKPQRANRRQKHLTKTERSE